MAQLSYTTPVITLQTRRFAYERFALMLTHLDYLNINLLSLTKNPDNTVTVTLSAPLPVEQVAHLGLDGT